jgi:hypothetical protein
MDRIALGQAEFLEDRAQLDCDRSSRSAVIVAPAPDDLLAGTIRAPQTGDGAKSALVQYEGS